VGFVIVIIRKIFIDNSITLAESIHHQLCGSSSIFSCGEFVIAKSKMC
jgi:hypothetical protein